MPADEAMATLRVIVANKRAAEDARRRSLRGRIGTLASLLEGVVVIPLLFALCAPAPIGIGLILALAGEPWHVAILATLAGAILAGALLLFFTLSWFLDAGVDETVSTRFQAYLLPNLVGGVVTLLVATLV